MKKYMIFAALMAASIVHAEITQSYQIGGLSSVRDHAWDSGRIVFADSIDSQLIFTVTVVANNGDTLLTDFAHLGVDSSSRQNDAAADRISNDESVTVTVSYVDPNGVLTGLKVKGFGAYWGHYAEETTVFTDASLNSTNLVAFNHDSGVLANYAMSGLDALTKDNTGSWSITASAGNAATESGFGGLKLEYTVNP